MYGHTLASARRCLVACLDPETTATQYLTSANREDPLHLIIERQFANFPAEQIRAVRSGLENASSTTIHVGTGCSGSEVLMHVLSTLHDFWYRKLGLDAQTKHLFAVEIVEWKRQWIMQHFSPEVIFEDISAFLTDSQLLKDTVSGNIVPVPTVDLWVCGFECDSVSALNIHAAENRRSISRGTGKTGQTAAGCIAYIERYKPPMFILENVKNLNAAPSRGGAGQPAKQATQLMPGGGVAQPAGQSNLEVLKARLQESGYSVLDECLQCSDFGFPQSRQRYYIMGFKHGDAHVLRRAHGILQDSKVSTLPLSAFLLSDDDPAVLRVGDWPGGGAEQPAAQKVKKEKKGADYLTDHCQAFAQFDIPWPPVFAEDFAEKVGCLAHRCQELVYFLEQVHKAELTMGCEFVADVNLSIQWCRARKREVPCIVSSSRMWALHRGRLLAGEELLALQGFSIQVQHDYCDTWSHKQLVDLAGNAYNGAVLAAVVTAVLASHQPPLPVGGGAGQPAACEATAQDLDGDAASSSDGSTLS